MGKLRLLAVLLAALLISGPAWAGKRVALVIGIGKYTTDSLPPLANPPNDARLMAATLRGLDFEVLVQLDLNQNGIRRAIRDFGAALDQAGEDAVGLFYYAGHGLQVKGNNYLLPADANIQREGDVEIEAVNANTVLSMMEFSRARLNFVIMDSCRNKPLSRSFRSATRGLARMDAPRGSLIAYATAPGKVAMDGEEKNSPYTKALAAAMKRPGLSVEQMFREVRNQVMAATKNFQVPWESSSLTGANFYFKGGAAAAPVQPTPQPQAAPRQQADIVAWQSIQGSTNAEEIEAFILAFRDSPFAGMARARLKALKKKQQVAAVVAPKPSPPPSQAKPTVGVFPKKPGDTFRDCADCPEMVVIPAGSFRMGDLNGGGQDDEQPVHNVAIPKPFAVGKYEVTQAEWRSVMGSNPSNFKGDRKPVETVSWDDAKTFVNKLSAKTGKQYRLLSEAEWEYMARAGASTKYSWGNSISQSHARYDSFGTVSVGSYAPNAFGVYDTAGNVLEWVEDCRHDSYNGAPSGGKAWTSGGDCFERVLRGGTWLEGSGILRSSNRFGGAPVLRSSYFGFRVARKLSPETDIKQQAAFVAPPKPSPPPSQVQPAVGIFPKKPGQTFRDCADCPEMVVIPAGSFRMGDLNGHGDVIEKPVHDVRIPRPLAVGMYEVTVGEYLACVDSGDCLEPEWRESESKYNARTGSDDHYRKFGTALTDDRHPIVGVSWNDAKQYVSWLGRRAGKQYSLLSESEWEYTARAGTATPFHFGPTISPDQANYIGNYAFNGGPKGVFRKRTVPVGEFQPNSFGHYNMHGNVWEWVEDCWYGSYNGAPSNGNAWVSSGDCSERVIRGGSWNDLPRNLRSASRNARTADFRGSYVGFRVARTLPDPSPPGVQSASALELDRSKGHALCSLKKNGGWMCDGPLQKVSSGKKPLETALKQSGCKEGRKVGVSGEWQIFQCSQDLGKRDILKKYKISN